MTAKLGNEPLTNSEKQRRFREKRTREETERGGPLTEIRCRMPPDRVDLLKQYVRRNGGSC